MKTIETPADVAIRHFGYNSARTPAQLLKAVQRRLVPHLDNQHARTVQWCQDRVADATTALTEAINSRSAPDAESNQLRAAVSDHHEALADYLGAVAVCAADDALLERAAEFRREAEGYIDAWLQIIDSTDRAKAAEAIAEAVRSGVRGGETRRGGGAPVGRSAVGRSAVGRHVIGSFGKPRSIIQTAYALYRARDLRITEDN